MKEHHLSLITRSPPPPIHEPEDLGFRKSASYVVREGGHPSPSNHWHFCWRSDQMTKKHRSTIQCVFQLTVRVTTHCAVTSCSVLQCVSVCHSVLQSVAGCCTCNYALRRHVMRCGAGCCSVLQCVPVCHSVLQSVAGCCRVQPCVTVCCTKFADDSSALQCVILVGVWQCVAGCCCVLWCLTASYRVLCVFE